MNDPTTSMYNDPSIIRALSVFKILDNHFIFNDHTVTIHPPTGTGPDSMATATIHLFINCLINTNISVLVLGHYGCQVCLICVV